MPEGGPWRPRRIGISCLRVRSCARWLWGRVVPRVPMVAIRASGVCCTAQWLVGAPWHWSQLGACSAHRLGHARPGVNPLAPNIDQRPHTVHPSPRYRVADSPGAQTFRPQKLPTKLAHLSVIGARLALGIFASVEIAPGFVKSKPGGRMGDADTGVCRRVLVLVECRGGSSAMTAAADAPISAFFISSSFPDPPNGRVSLKYRI